MEHFNNIAPSFSDMAFPAADGAHFVCQQVGNGFQRRFNVLIRSSLLRIRVLAYGASWALSATQQHGRVNLKSPSAVIFSANAWWIGLQETWGKWEGWGGLKAIFSGDQQTSGR